jgi:hypothetical protein
MLLPICSVTEAREQPFQPLIDHAFSAAASMAVTNASHRRSSSPPVTFMIVFDPGKAVTPYWVIRAGLDLLWVRSDQRGSGLGTRETTSRPQRTDRWCCASWLRLLGYGVEAAADI